MVLHQAPGAADRSILRRSSGWRVPLCIAAVSIPASLADAARVLLRYDRTALSDGELWRLGTGHITHLGTSHLLLNLAGLAVVWLLVGSAVCLLDWLIVIACGILFIDLGFWVFNPQLEWYVGLSGLLHTMLVAGIAGQFREAPTESILLAVVVAGKLAWEQLAGPLPGSESSAGGPVVVDAHLYGAIAGIIAAGLIRARSRWNLPA